MEKPSMGAEQLAFCFLRKLSCQFYILLQTKSCQLAETLGMGQGR